MNRRDFLKGIAAMVAAWLLPKPKEQFEGTDTIINSEYVDAYVGVPCPAIESGFVSGPKPKDEVSAESEELFRAWLKDDDDQRFWEREPDSGSFGIDNDCDFEVTMQYEQCLPVPDPPPVELDTYDPIPDVMGWQSGNIVWITHDQGSTWEKLGTIV